MHVRELLFVANTASGDDARSFRSSPAARDAEWICANLVGSLAKTRPGIRVRKRFAPVGPSRFSSPLARKRNRAKVVLTASWPLGRKTQI